jgi:group I intron endonuclease
MGYIYKITNIINGMMYIGQTTSSLEKRWKEHLKPSSNCRYLKSALKKYGIDNFNFKLICICFDSDLDNVEIEYIEMLNTLVPNGYNLRQGGNKGKHSEGTKKKISDALIGRSKPRPKTGIPLSEETKKKISISCKEKSKIKENGTNVNQYSLNNHFIKHYLSITDASNEINGDRSHIRKCCNGTRQTAYGFKWSYY